MRLIGRYASPFVRRVAITMRLYGIPYEHESVIPFGDSKSSLEAVNPITRVPTLILDNGEALVDSAAILDFLDELAGPDQALVPPSGDARRKVMRLLAVALGTMDKVVAVNYERRFRPKEIWHRPWLEQCDKQVTDGYRWLDNAFEGEWLAGTNMTQADITLAVFWDFGRATRPNFMDRLGCGRIAEMADLLEATAPFQATQREAEPLPSNALE